MNGIPVKNQNHVKTVATVTHAMEAIAGVDAAEIDDAVAAVDVVDVANNLAYPILLIFNDPV